MHNRPMIFSLQSRAEQNVEYIRSVMDRAEGVSSVSGLGGLGMGACGVVATSIAHGFETLQEQIVVWAVAALVALPLGGVASVVKARRSVLQWDPVRRFLLCLMPCLFGAALVSVELYQLQMWSIIPPLWLIFYGCGLLAAGTYAVFAVRVMGAVFFILGLGALYLPLDNLNLVLGAGFGSAHLIFGGWVYKNHGG